MTRKTLVGTALAVLTLGAVLAGCTTTSSSNGMTSSTTAAPGSQRGEHNQADVAFAQQMIPHHKQALGMAELVAGHTANARVIDLAARIQKAQEPEIQQMTSWLTTWGAGPGDMSGMTSGMPVSTTTVSAPMTGMMSAGDMTKLGQARGADFDRMWLQMMIQHHQGAIDMARTELSQGGNPDAKALAQKIIDGQQAEITEMKGLLVQS